MANEQILEIVDHGGIIYQKVVDNNREKIYMSRFPWGEVVNNAYGKWPSHIKEFELKELIMWYIIDFELINNKDWESFEHVRRYLISEYDKYKNIPPMEFEINKDDLCNLLYEYYDSHDYINKGWRAEYDYDFLMRYDRVPEILFQCHWFARDEYLVIADYLLTVKKHEQLTCISDIPIKDNTNNEVPTTNKIIYYEDMDIKKLLKLKLEDKLRFLGID